MLLLQVPTPSDQELQFSVDNQNSGSVSPKNIVLFARDGPDSTILDGEDNKQLFTIDTQNDTTLKIIGFTIQNGGGDFGGAAVSVAGVYVGQTNGNDNYNPSGAVFENCEYNEKGFVGIENLIKTNTYPKGTRF